jgi:hypothetical protein
MEAMLDSNKQPGKKIQGGKKGISDLSWIKKRANIAEETPIREK